MKIKNNFKSSLRTVSVAFIGLISLAGCSSMRGKSESSEKISAAGPTVLNARTVPGTIELNRSLNPKTNAEILADVKDFTSTISSVSLRFKHVPLEVPMRNIGGTTWSTELTPRQLQMLAVSGQTMTYDADVIAKNEQGKTGIGAQSVQVAIKAPDLSTASS